METPTTDTSAAWHPRSRLAAHLQAAERTIAGYNKMAKVAEHHGMEYETERIERNLTEAEGDADQIRYAMIELGYDPE
jgi:hypothetical protein